MENRKVAVLGSGSWATAIVKILSENSCEVNWWVRHEESRVHITRYGHNPKYLQSAHLNTKNINLFSSLNEAIVHSYVVIVAIPSAFVESCFVNFDKINFENKLVFSAVKGFISNTNLIPAQFFLSKYDLKNDSVGIICGPCHAEEIALERLSYLTVACKNKLNAEKISDLLENRYLRTSVSDDLIGTEYAAVLKNVYALAAGISSGLGYGDNYQAILISNAIQELERFIDYISPVHRDTKSSAYLGDLLVTSYSSFSRNRTFGSMIGKGYTVKAAQLEMNMIAEGYYALKSIFEINKNYKVSMPIMEKTYEIIYNRKNPRTEFYELSKMLS